MNHLNDMCNIDFEFYLDGYGRESFKWYV